MRSKFKTITTPSVIAVLNLMADGISRTIREISEATNLSVPTAQSAINALEHYEKVHLHHYSELPIGGMAPFWLIGCGERAKPPKKQTRAQRLAQMKAYREKTARKSRAFEAAPFRDPMVAALFGEAAPLASMAKLTRHIIRQSMEVDDEEMAA